MDTPLTTRNSYYLELSTIFHLLATHNYDTVSHSKGTGVKTEKSFSDFDSQECVFVWLYCNHELCFMRCAINQLRHFSLNEQITIPNAIIGFKHIDSLAFFILLHLK